MSDPKQFFSEFEQSRYENKYWASLLIHVVKKNGGEIRLKQIDLTELPEVSNLEIFYDEKTDERVIKVVEHD